MSSLAHLVTEILQAREFQTSGDGGYLLAKKGESEVAFCLLESPDHIAVDSFLTRFKDFTGKKVVATLAALPPTFVESLDRSVVIWDREALEHEIGRTRIERVVGDRDHGLVDELVADDYPKMVSPELLEDIPEPSVGERIIRPVLGVEDVKELSRQTVAGFRHRLELVPHYVYGYVCPLYMGDEKVSVERGLLSINGLTHKVESWNERTDVVYTLDVAHKRLEPSISGDEAKRLARRELVRVNSYDRENVREENHVTITEKKKVAPKEDEIVFEDRGTFYIPIWCVEGVHGIMIINAGTGKIVSEDYYTI